MGFVDLFITTGDLHDWEPTGDLILKGAADGQFEDVASEAGEYFLSETMGRGAAVGDLDNDGDLDVVLNRLGDRPVLLKNQQENHHHWIRLRLVGRTTNRDAVGAQVILESPLGSQLGVVKTGSGYLGSSDPRIHFGLGESAQIDRIRILWPDGSEETLEGLPAERLQVVEQSR